jgi:hypothetical protein
MRRKHVKKSTTAALLLVLVLIFANGCKQTVYNGEEDKNIVIAEVNTVKLYKAELDDRWSTVLPMMDAVFAGLNESEIEQKELEHKLKILDSMIAAEINRQKSISKEFNISLTSKEIEKLDKRYKEVIAGMEDYILNNFKAAGITEVSEQQMTAELKAFFVGQGTTREDYYEDMRSIEIRKKLQTVIKNEVEKVDYMEIEIFYENLLAQQQRIYTENSARYEADMRDGDLVLFNLDGYRAYRKIFIPYLDEDQEMIQYMISNKLKEETIGAIKIAFGNLYGPITELYNELDRKTKSFDEIAKAYNPATAEKVYYISDETKIFTEDTKDAATSLKTIGDYSTVMSQTNGVLIWKLEGDNLKTGIVPLENIMDQITGLALEEKRSRYWEQRQKEWHGESNIKIYENRLK